MNKTKRIINKNKNYKIEVIVEENNNKESEL